MQNFNEYLSKYRKENIGTQFSFIGQTILNWIKNDREPEIEKVCKSLEFYKVSLEFNESDQRNTLKKSSAILKRCEGARGILYMNDDAEHRILPHSVLKRTRIIEVKDVSMKIRVHESEVVNQLIYIENVLGFLKEVD